MVQCAAAYRTIYSYPKRQLLVNHACYGGFVPVEAFTSLAPAPFLLLFFVSLHITTTTVTALSTAATLAASFDSTFDYYHPTGILA
jgi:hypothetical protein